MFFFIPSKLSFQSKYKKSEACKIGTAEESLNEFFLLNIPKLVNYKSPGDNLGFMSSVSSQGWDEYEIEDTDEDGTDVERNCYERLKVDKGKLERESRKVESNDAYNGIAVDSTTDEILYDDGLSNISHFRSASFTHIVVSDDTVCGNIDPCHVRWFYRQEIEKKWTPFIGYDSLRLEVRYRIAKGENYDVGLVSSLSEHEKELLFKGERLVVRGGLYEVDVTSRSCFSVFWTGEQSVITRGTWFYDGSWQPIEDPFSETIEEGHLFMFRDQDPSELQLNTSRRTVSEAGYKIQRGYYCDATLVDKQPDITHLVFVVHGIGQKMDNEKIIRNCGSLRKCSNWLKEKYFSHLNESKERSEFFPVEWRSSLKLDGDTVESITPHRVRGLRDFLNCSALDVLYYTSPRYRSELICGLQDKMNGLYQQFCLRNPHFESSGGRISIVAHSLGAVISYDIITSWNPCSSYETYVEGGLNALPKLTNCDPELVCKLQEARNTVSMLEMELCSNSESSTSKKNGLLFSIENLFCLGSPLAVFLALHGVRPKPRGSREDILSMSLVRRLFNIYHPTDPVAYRLEPLILKHYTSILPLPIYYYGTADKVPYELLKTEYLPQETLDKRPHSPPADDASDSTNVSPNKVVRGVTAEGRWSSYFLPSFMRRKSVIPLSNSSPTQIMQMKMLQAIEDSDVGEPSLDLSPTQDTADVPQSSSAILEDSLELIELEHRLDFVLREGNLESSYISALTSHTAYWNSYDVAYFILSYLHSTADGKSSPNPLSPQSEPDQ